MQYAIIRGFLGYDFRVVSAPTNLILWRKSVKNYLLSLTYSESSQTFKMEPQTIFTKCSILDSWLGSEHACGSYYLKYCLQNIKNIKVKIWMYKYLQVNCKIVQKILIVRSTFKKILYCFFLYYILIKLYLVLSIFCLNFVLR